MPVTRSETHGPSEEIRGREALLMQTVEALAGAVERRDPHAAGHHRKVTRLAVAIARKMGLAEERIEGLRLAALLHDVGMVEVPCDLISHPGPLRPADFRVIQRHPEAGYEILREVLFPWPVAEMVRQHHERLDGSGYPRGLRGEEILLEASILAVADVVAAIGSPRAYRPSLGVNRALEEIQAYRGARYEPRVADACMALFGEEGFSIDGTVE